MKPEIFKAYDIRGLVPSQLDTPAALAIGRAIARHLGGGPIAVGNDMRESGVALGDALVAGMRGEGAEVVRVGRVATPMLYFATAHLGAAGGVMITASHNPGGYNGFKICGEMARPIGIASGLAEIRDIAQRLHGESTPEPRGALRHTDVSADYHASLLRMFSARPRLKVVIDAGNGIAGEAVEGLLSQLPLDVERLYFEPDGTFPNHEANPLEAENLEDLCAAVRASGADLGIAFDGDGDRAVFVDEKAEPVPADLMTALMADVVLADDLLGARAGCSIAYDLRSSRIVPETIRAAGAEPLRGRVGHAFMKQLMREVDSPFGGELSGHYYFRFPSGYVADDAAAAAMLLFFAIERRGCALSELWQPYRRYAQSGEINSRVADVRATLERVQAAHPDGRADELDGLTVQYDDWWFNLRPSNTEPLLRLNLEAPTPERMASHRDALLALVQAAA